LQLLTTTENGLYCAAGDFYIDPWRGVARAVITHAHSDHARAGSKAYLCPADGARVLRRRLGPAAVIKTQPYGVPRKIGDVALTFYPAGHILGSAQVLLEYAGHRWVVSGDYKTEADRTCRAHEVVPCHVFITESTFGLPIYRWQPQAEVFARINNWWAENKAAGTCSVVYAYSLGKAQRILGNVDASIGPIVVHPAVAEATEDYTAEGIGMPAYATAFDRQQHAGALVVAPPGTADSPWLRQLGEVRTAFASGWMQVRGNRRRQNLDAGFALSDHADWPGLLHTIAATGAERVLVTHGFVDTLVAYLQEQGTDAAPLATPFASDDAKVIVKGEAD
jgi:putative mRNA 3-end processing factor